MVEQTGNRRPPVSCSGAGGVGGGLAPKHRFLTYDCPMLGWKSPHQPALHQINPRVRTTTKGWYFVIPRTQAMQ